MLVVRNFNGLLIPTAIPIAINAGSNIEIKQNKGGFATIIFQNNLVRVAAQDFDAIGLDVQGVELNKTSGSCGTTLDLVWEILKTCYDPEVPVNIVDLGLIYSCCIIDNKVLINMSLTAPMCNMGPILISDLKNKILNIPEITDVEVITVFDPPWTIDRMSQTAKIELGLV